MKLSTYNLRSVLPRLVFSLGMLISSVPLISTVLAPAPALAACSALPSSLGTATLSISVPSSTTYRVWVRELAPSSSASSFYLQIPDSGTCGIAMGGASIPANTWTWVDYQNGTASSVINATLSSGSHSVELAGKSSGVELDKILLLSDASCTPTGDGSNCTQAAVTTGGASPSSSPTSISASSATTTATSGDISVTPSSLPPGTTVEYFLDGKRIASGNINTRNLSNGKHVITIKTISPDGQVSTQTKTIMVNNPLTPMQRVAAFVQSNRAVLLVVGFLIIAVPLGWLAALHFGLLPHAGGPGAPPAADETASPALAPLASPEPEPSTLPPAQEPPATPIPPAEPEPPVAAPPPGPPIT